MSQECKGNYIRWIKLVFNECVVTTDDKWSFGVGMLSNVIWLVCSLPQIIQNCQTKVVEGQSPFFFSLIFTANVVSYIGLLINGGLITQYLTSAIYVILDGILFLQYIIYSYCCKQNVSPTQNESPENEDVIIPSSPSAMPMSVAGGTALLAATAVSKIDYSAPYKKDTIVGTIFGWIGTVIYIISRIPQASKNCSDKKVRDLSPFYVFLSICGNITYALSIFIKSMDGTFLWGQLPWIVGCFGPMLFDFIFLFQMCIYGIESTNTEAEKKRNDVNSFLLL